MGFMDKLRGELIDIIEFLDDSRDTIVWRFLAYSAIKDVIQATFTMSSGAAPRERSLAGRARPWWRPLLQRWNMERRRPSSSP